MSVRGKHCMADAAGCDPARLDDAGRVERALRKAAERGGATLLDVTVRAFRPQGVTAVALLAESHASVHTWPEHGYAAIDAFTCGDADPAAICRCIADALGAVSVHERLIERGTACIAHRGPVAARGGALPTTRMDPTGSEREAIDV